MDMSAIGILLSAARVRLPQPHKGPSETTTKLSVSGLARKLQPPKGPSETIAVAGAAILLLRLQFHKGPSETSPKRTPCKASYRFNPIRVRLKRLDQQLINLYREWLQPPKGPSETADDRHRI